MPFFICLRYLHINNVLLLLHSYILIIYCTSYTQLDICLSLNGHCCFHVFSWKQCVSPMSIIFQESSSVKMIESCLEMVSPSKSDKKSPYLADVKSLVAPQHKLHRWNVTLVSYLMAMLGELCHFRRPELSEIIFSLNVYKNQRLFIDPVVRSYPQIKLNFFCALFCFTIGISIHLLRPEPTEVLLYTQPGVGLGLPRISLCRWCFKFGMIAGLMIAWNCSFDL